MYYGSERNKIFKELKHRAKRFILSRYLSITSVQFLIYFGKIIRGANLPHSAPSSILCLAENLESSSSKWHYNCKEPSIHPAGQPAITPLGSVQVLYKHVKGGWGVKVICLFYLCGSGGRGSRGKMLM